VPSFATHSPNAAGVIGMSNTREVALQVSGGMTHQAGVHKSKR
jgi:hypothetical protein